MQLNTIEAKTTHYAQQREALAAVVTELNDAIEALKRKHMGVIKRRVAAAAEAHGALHEAIAASPHLFERPRSVIIAGIKVGYAKGVGAITWANEQKVVEAIRKHLSGDFDLLVKTTHKPIKKALANLPATDLKKIGVTVEDTGDQVLIKPTDTAVDKLVSALLAEATEEVVA